MQTINAGDTLLFVKDDLKPKSRYKFEVVGRVEKLLNTPPVAGNITFKTIFVDLQSVP